MTIAEVITWVAFAGSWLLVMGPVYQAALELPKEDQLRDTISVARSRKFRTKVMNPLAPDVTESLVTYMSKAKGWLYVAVPMNRARSFVHDSAARVEGDPAS